MNDDISFDESLRRAIRAAADSVEPGADGLDRILAKARARRARRPVRYGLAAAVRRASLAVPSRTGPLAWLAAACRWIADGFRVDADLPGRLGWLRPAAALATALFVATGAAWAITTLPQMMTSVAGLRYHPVGVTGPAHPGASSPSPGVTETGTGAAVGPGGSGTPSPSPTCTNGHNIRPYTPSPGGSPSTTPSPSPSPSPSGSGSGTPSPSPDATSASPSPAASALASSDAATATPTPTPTPTPTQTPPSSPGPCG